MEEVKNEVFIRGKLISKTDKGDFIFAKVSCTCGIDGTRNYQFVAFADEMKDAVSAISEFESVDIKATAWMKRDPESDFIDINNVRLRGISIEKTTDVRKRVLARTGESIYGVQFKDCARFSFSGKIDGLKLNEEEGNRRVSILLHVDNDRGGFDRIPLIFTGRYDEEVDGVVNTYPRGSFVSVNGFISQKSYPEVVDGKTVMRNKNTYYITNFNTGTADILD